MGKHLGKKYSVWLNQDEQHIVEQWQRTYTISQLFRLLLKVSSNHAAVIAKFLEAAK
jgi:hypothetical protein